MLSFKYFLIVFVTLLIASVYLYGGQIQGLITGTLPLIRPAPQLPVSEPLPFTLPRGFRATMYEPNAPGARVLTRDSRGVLAVSLTKEGKVVLLPDDDGDGVSDAVIPLIEGLRNPHGIIFYDNRLFVAEEHKLVEYEYSPQAQLATKPKTIMELPLSGGHYTRSIHMEPWGKRILVSVGSSCNVCNEEDDRRAKILTYDLESGSIGEYARGLRNTVFMAPHPVTGELWGTDMGRDLLGDDIPPDEINILRDGGNYGWPICFGKNVHDTDFDTNTYIRNPCMEPHESPSHIDIPAHSAPLGLAFIPEEGWPEEHWHDLVVAYHGSWNRSVPTGYKLVKFDLTEKGELIGVSDFMTGFMANEDVIGRPAGILVEPGGVMYVSDDRAGAVYRIQYVGI